MGDKTLDTVAVAIKLLQIRPSFMALDSSDKVENYSIKIEK